MRTTRFVLIIANLIIITSERTGENLFSSGASDVISSAIMPFIFQYFSRIYFSTLLFFCDLRKEELSAPTTLRALPA